MAYTRLKNNIDAINYAITKNRIGVPSDVDGESVVMLAEDLSNFVDVGKNIADLDADSLKSFAKDVVTGVARTEFITRLYTAETHGIVKTVDKYNGALQRCALKNVTTVQDSHARNLISGVNYIDGKFYGFDIDSVIFSDEFNFKTAYSIGYDDIEARWDNIAWVDRTIGEIEVAVRNSIEIKLKGIADTLLNKAIVDTIESGRKVPLITKFNEYYGYSGANAKTKNDIVTNKELRNEFCIFVALGLDLIKSNMRMMSKKYNDGSVEMFTPNDRINIIGLTEFMDLIRDIDVNGIIDAENVHKTICWQSFGNGVLPLFDDCSTIKDGTFTLDDDGTSIESEDAETTSNIVMFMYDSDMLGVTKCLDKVTTEYVGSEGYTTYFEHYAIRQYLDKRSNAVVFTLD